MVFDICVEILFLLCRDIFLKGEKKMRRDLLLVLLLWVLFVGCTDARMNKFKTFGDERHVVCWSGGKVILDTYSTGRVLSEDGSNGYYFEERGSGEFIEVDADCVFRTVSK